MNLAERTLKFEGCNFYDVFKGKFQMITMKNIKGINRYVVT